MTTRSGLTINTVPRGKKFTTLRKNSPFIPSSQDEGKSPAKRKLSQCVFRSDHGLSFVTRHYMSRRLTGLDFEAISFDEFRNWKEELLWLWELQKAELCQRRDQNALAKALDDDEAVCYDPVAILWDRANYLLSKAHCSSLQESDSQLCYILPKYSENDTSCVEPTLPTESQLSYQQLLLSSEPGLSLVELDSLPSCFPVKLGIPSVFPTTSVASSPKNLSTEHGNLMGEEFTADNEINENKQENGGNTKLYSESESNGIVDDSKLKLHESDTELQDKSPYKSHASTSGANRNACKICGKIFSRSWLLKGHVRTHTGERPFRCTFPNCDKAFADKSNLRSHLLIHKTERKTYSCPKCSRSFAQKRYLHKHMQEVCRML